MTSLSCGPGTPTALSDQMIRSHRDHLNRQVLTWNQTLIKGPIISTSVFFLPFLPLFLLALIDSLNHSSSTNLQKLHCLYRSVFFALPLRVSPPVPSTWVSALFLVRLRKNETVYYGLLLFECLPVFPFTF